MTTKNTNNVEVNPFNGEEVKQEIMVARVDIPTADLMNQLKNPNHQFFCSIKDDGKMETKIKIYNAINVVDDSVSKHINEVLEIVDVVAHPVTLADEQTGEVIEGLRTVLIDKNGKSYDAVSQGITNSLSRIFSLFGMPDKWEQPLKMKIKQIETRNGNNKVNTIELV